MPAAFEYLDPNDIKRKDLGGKDERNAIETDYNQNKKYYLGEQPEWLIRQPDDPVKDSLVVNVTKQAVDRTLSFLFPEVPVFQLDVNQETDDEAWLNNAWIVNGGAYLLAQIAEHGALRGHTYVRILKPKTGESFPRIVPINPTIPITYWKADDVQTPLWHEFSFKVGDDFILIDFINRSNKWEIVTYKSVNNGTSYDEVSREMWNYYIPPVVDSQHLPNPGQYYGRPEISKNSRELNDYINRVASDVGKILRYYASPRTIATGVEKEEIQKTDIDRLWTISDPNAKVFNLEMESDLQSSMNYLQYLNDMYLSLSRVVIMRGTVKDFQRVTNTGIRAVFLDMIAKNQLLRWTYGLALQKICQAVLFMGNKVTSIIPTVDWSDPLPTDELETVNKLAIEQGNGWLDPETASKLLGYEWETVKSRLLQAIKDGIIADPSGNSSIVTRLGKTNTNEVSV